MINFEQILKWIQSIFKLSTDVEPIIRQIKDSVKIKTINGIEFIEQTDPTLKSLQDLNKVLIQNGIDPINEEQFLVPKLDIEEITRIMQNDFTEEELADAISAPIISDPGKEFTQIDFELADVCAPVVPDQGNNFSEKEFIDAACEIVKEPPAEIVSVKQVPTTQPTISIDEELPLPATTDDVINQASEKMKDGLSSDLFDKNGPDCFKKMQEISLKVQKDIEAYNKIKQSLQEIQLDYYYETIVYTFYNSFIGGYTQLKDTREKGASEDLKGLVERYPSTLSKSDVQDRLKESIFPFSSQFEIEIDTGFLGLFQSAPSIKVNKEIELTGKIKTSTDDLLSYIDTVDKSLSDSSEKISKRAKSSEKELDDSFTKTINAVKNFSTGFGISEAIKQNEIDQEVLDTAKKLEESYKPLEEKYLGLKKQEEEIEKKIENIQREISGELAKLNCENREIITDIEPGGIPNFKNVSRGPTIFDYTWWKKFSELATLVNLVPVHWPVGLVIPTPSGIIKVPFPIIWIPLFVAGSDKLLSVLFIGQCGILPCPFVYFQHFLEIPLGSFESNNPYFIVAIRGPINIRSHRPLPPSTLPSFDLIFELISAALDNYRKGIQVDVTALLSEIGNQFDDIKASANRYAALSEKEVSDILKNAKEQGNALVSSAKDSAAAVIKQAQEEGEARIKEIQERYNDTDITFPQISQIRNQIQEEIKRAEQQIEDARQQAKQIIENSENIAEGLKEKARQTLQAIIDNGTNLYQEKLDELEQIREIARETIKTLREFIDRIKVPAIDISSIDLNALLESYKLSLGSMKALAADLSPRAIEFGFPKEISPQFSQILPILDDDLPPWERLTLLNIPFVLFLWKWCQAGKKKGGFFENAF